MLGGSPVVLFFFTKYLGEIYPNRQYVNNLFLTATLAIWLFVMKRDVKLLTNLPPWLHGQESNADH